MVPSQPDVYFPQSHQDFWFHLLALISKTLVPKNSRNLAESEQFLDLGQKQMPKIPKAHHQGCKQVCFIHEIKPHFRCSLYLILCYLPPEESEQKTPPNQLSVPSSFRFTRQDSAHARAAFLAQCRLPFCRAPSASCRWGDGRRAAGQSPCEALRGWTSCFMDEETT